MIGGKRIDIRPTWTNNMQTHRRRAIMQQVVKQNAGISSMSTYKLNKNIKIKMNSNKDSMLKDNQDNIKANESITKTNKIYSNMNIHVKVGRIIIVRAKSIC